MTLIARIPTHHVRDGLNQDTRTYPCSLRNRNVDKLLASYLSLVKTTNGELSASDYFGRERKTKYSLKLFGTRSVAVLFRTSGIQLTRQPILHKSLEERPVRDITHT